ncbi:uridine kinase [Pelomyxa schiedti]|nr:uridine kinase [Pelomyxa schiedti]
MTTTPSPTTPLPVSSSSSRGTSPPSRSPSPASSHRIETPTAIHSSSTSSSEQNGNGITSAATPPPPSQTPPPSASTSATHVIEGRRPWYDPEGFTRKPIVIGITGGSASGKTHICTEVVRLLSEAGTTDPQWCLVIGLESFYKDLTEEQLLHPEAVNFDCPEAIDYTSLITVLRDLKAGRRAYIPKYDYALYKNVGKKVVYGADVILVEGTLVFNCPELIQMLDIKLFVDTDDDIRLARRLRKDVTDRGRPLDKVLERYSRFVKPGFTQYVLPMKKKADIIIPTSDRSEVVVDLILKRIDKELRERGWEPQLRPLTNNARPEGVVVLPETEQIRVMHTILRNDQTSHEDFMFYSDRLVSLLIEQALQLLPYVSKTVTTPTGAPYEGKVFTAKPCGVSIMPGGSSMEGPLRRVCKGIRLGKILIKSNPGKGPSLIYVKLPKVMAERSVLLLDPMLQSGATVTMAIRVLLDHGVPQANITFITFVSSLQGLQDVKRKFPGITIVTSVIDTSGDPKSMGFINPEIAYHSARYFGQ